MSKNVTVQLNMKSYKYIWPLLPTLSPLSKNRKQMLLYGTDFLLPAPFWELNKKCLDLLPFDAFSCKDVFVDYTFAFIGLVRVGAGS